MKSLLLSFICIGGFYSGFAQHYDYKEIKQKVDSLMWSGERKPAVALLLGTWHFGYPNLDAHKTKQEDMVDVLSPQRQKELDEVIAVLKRYNPTRIYVESGSQSRIDSIYNNYLSGNYKLRRDEVDQIALRLGKEIGLSKLYAVDDNNFLNQYYNQLPFYDSLEKATFAIDAAKDEYWDKRYRRMYDYGDSILKHQTILEHLLMMADPYVLKRNHGHYLASGFETNNDAGADLLSMWWYSRNLRIYRNILATQPSSDDRILVIFGNGHMSILRHVFESTPEFNLVELKDLLRKK